MNTRSSLSKTVLIVALIVIVGAALWFSIPRSTAPAFCFDFVRDMQFGDRVVAKPVNQGTVVKGVTYYYPETPALQTALQKQGFYVDPYESTGGHVYAGSFFGPSTRAAVMSFQKKYGLAQTGEVNNDTLDKLASLYSCPKPAATTTSATTTP
ncbi:MAG TPA: peptidoglycan-binding domain-containing protein [Candidatus Paceibacterota bacterium]|nr:peptidoglycan-binding domain-containing protein [Candidatus Paceibacterota bacterium]